MIKINLNNDMTLIMEQNQENKKIMAKMVMGQNEKMDINNIVSEIEVDETTLADLILGNNDATSALYEFAKCEAEYRFNKYNISFTEDDVCDLADELWDCSETWVDGEVLDDMAVSYIKEKDLGQKDITFTDKNELINYVTQQHDMYCESADFTSLFFDNVYVKDMKESDILDAYKSIQMHVNGDYILCLENIQLVKHNEDTFIYGEEKSLKDFANYPQFQNTYSGNVGDYLKKYNSSDENASPYICRVMENDCDDADTSLGILLEFLP